jgi:hypothetical protein
MVCHVYHVVWLWAFPLMMLPFCPTPEIQDHLGGMGFTCFKTVWVPEGSGGDSSEFRVEGDCSRLASQVSIFGEEAPGITGHCKWNAIVVNHLPPAAPKPQGRRRDPLPAASRAASASLLDRCDEKLE